MTHSYNMVVAPRQKQEEFVSWVLDKRYKTFHPNRLGITAQPNVREVRFYAVDIKKEFLKEFLTALTPYDFTGTGKLKSFLRSVFGQFSGMSKLEPVPLVQTKKIPDWRCYVVVYVFGMEPRGDSNRVYMVMTAQRKYLDELEVYLLSRSFKKGKTHDSPKINEVRLYDISNFETTMGHLHNDLNPVFKITALMGKWQSRLYEFFLKKFGGYLSPKASEAIPIKEDWRKDIEIYHLGMIPDEWAKNNNGMIIEENI